MKGKFSLPTLGKILATFKESHLYFMENGLVHLKLQISFSCPTFTSCHFILDILVRLWRLSGRRSTVRRDVDVVGGGDQLRAALGRAAADRNRVSDAGELHRWHLVHIKHIILVGSCYKWPSLNFQKTGNIVIFLVPLSYSCKQGAMV